MDSGPSRLVFSAASKNNAPADDEVEVDVVGDSRPADADATTTTTHASLFPSATSTSASTNIASQMTAIPQPPINPSVWHVQHWVQQSPYVAAAAAAAAAKPLPVGPSSGTFMTPSAAGAVAAGGIAGVQQGPVAHTASSTPVMTSPAGAIIPGSLPGQGQHWSPYPTVVPWPTGAEFCKVVAGPTTQQTPAGYQQQPNVWPIGAIRLPYFVANPGEAAVPPPNSSSPVTSNRHSSSNIQPGQAAGNSHCHVIHPKQVTSTCSHDQNLQSRIAACSGGEVEVVRSAVSDGSAARNQGHHLRIERDMSDRESDDEDNEELRVDDEPDEEHAAAMQTHSNHLTSGKASSSSSANIASSPSQEGRSDGPENFRKRLIGRWMKPKSEAMSSGTLAEPQMASNLVANTVTVSAAHQPHHVSSVMMFAPASSPMLQGPPKPGATHPLPPHMVPMANVSMARYPPGQRLPDGYIATGLSPGGNMPVKRRELLPGPPKSTGGPLRLPTQPFSVDKPTSPERARCSICGTMACGSRSALTNRSGPPRRHYFSCKVARQRLQEWMNRHQDHPYPTKSERAQLLKETGMSRVQLQNWFGNHRRRLKSQRLQEGSSNGSKDGHSEEFGMESDSDMDTMPDNNDGDDDINIVEV